MSYIKREPLLQVAKELQGSAFGSPLIVKVIEDAPVEDVVEVIHGYNKLFDYPSLFECSVCSAYDNDTYTGESSEYNYCPWCGAKMDGERMENNDDSQRT